MEINTKKIKAEMIRLGINHETLGKMMTPPRGRTNVIYLIQCGRTFKIIEQIAEALNFDPKDLII